MWNDRTSLLIGKEGLKILEQSHVAVIGIGGVGGYVTQLLARAGIGKITIVDFDRVDETNINRQVVANIDTIGQLKTDVMYQQIRKINPLCNVRVLADKISKDNIEKVISPDCSYVVDAIDNVTNKIELISYCKKNNINIISAMGAGNRICIPEFIVTDIYKTQNDGLAKILRKKLREENIDCLDVVTTLQKPLKSSDDGVIGSISYFPAMCGCVISAFVINKLLQNKNFNGGKNGNN